MDEMTGNYNTNHIDWLTPGQNELVPVWDEYKQLKEAVNNYLDHEPEDPAWNNIWRAFGAIIGEYQANPFAQAFDLDETAEHACICRLITGDTECHH